jgi:hypothetical protein
VHPRLLAALAALAILLVPFAAAAQVPLPGLDLPPGGDDVVWLCRPGLPDDPCEIPLDTTVREPDGSERVETPERQPVEERPVDCFYVYPTVSNQPTPNASKTRDPELRSIAQYQAARFSAQCRVFAPVYRQATLANLAVSGQVPPANLADRDLAYARRPRRLAGLPGERQRRPRRRPPRSLAGLGVAPHAAPARDRAGPGAATAPRRGAAARHHRHHRRGTNHRRGLRRGADLHPPRRARLHRHVRQLRRGPAGEQPLRADRGARSRGRLHRPRPAQRPERSVRHHGPERAVLPRHHPPRDHAHERRAAPSAPTTWVTPPDRFEGGCAVIDGAHVLRYEPIGEARRPSTFPRRFVGHPPHRREPRPRAAGRHRRPPGDGVARRPGRGGGTAGGAG